MQLKKAERKQVNLKIGLSGPSGSGKTYSSLLLAYGLCQDWTKISVIDTENNSAELYSHLGDYNVLPLSQPYTPERYIEAIETCYNAGMKVIIIDSITQEWDGPGGCLEIQEQLGGRYQDWAKVTPRHRNFINAILQTNCHIITTVRRKQDYDMTKNNSGKTIVQKVGTKEITREGFEYELTLNFELTVPNYLCKSSKDRTGLFSNRPEFVITSDTGKELINWSNSGKEIEQPVEQPVEQKSENKPQKQKYTGLYHDTGEQISPELKTYLGALMDELGYSNAQKNELLIKYDNFEELSFQLEFEKSNAKEGKLL